MLLWLKMSLMSLEGHQILRVRLIPTLSQGGRQFRHRSHSPVWPCLLTFSISAAGLRIGGCQSSFVRCFQTLFLRLGSVLQENPVILLCSGQIPDVAVPLLFGSSLRLWFDVFLEPQ